MKFKKNNLFKILILTIGALIPIGLGIGLYFNIKNYHKTESNQIRDVINNNLGNKNVLLNDANNIDWNLDKIDFISKRINYLDQSYVNDFSQMLNNNTNAVNNQTYFNHIITSNSLSLNKDVTNYFNLITNVNLTTMVDNLNDSYKYRYYKNSDVTYYDVDIKNPDIYLNVTSASEYENISNNDIFDFSLAAIDINQDLKYNLQTIKDNIDLNATNSILFQNSFYTITKNQYQQKVDNHGNYITNNQLLVDWTNPSETNNYIDTSTSDFWIELLLLFKDVSRIVVKPANLIIYRSNENISNYNISLNSYNANSLLKNNAISIDSWTETCINQNPSTDFDFRANIINNRLETIDDINIPLIINVNDQEYLNSKKYSSPNLIVNSILFASNQQINNRNWGNKYFQNLKTLTISMNPKNAIYNLTSSNPLSKAETFTNAITNTGFSDGSGPIFSNQFFVLPNLLNFNTNSVEIYFANFKSVSYLPLYKFYNIDFSDASYTRYQNINLNFLCEENSGYHFRLLDKTSTSSANNSLNEINLNKLLNNYINFFNQNRDTNSEWYFYYNSNQMQWKSFDFIINSIKGYRYEFIYGFYNYLISIVFPFSMIATIQGADNPLYLTSNNQLIARYIDPSTNTIVYNSHLVINGNENIYPPFLLDNNQFRDFVIKKKASNSNNVIDLTFEDWIKYGWTGIDKNIDIYQIMNEENVTFNEFTIPNIISMNVNTTMLLDNQVINKDLIISLVLIILISIFGFIEIIMLIIILKSSNGKKWVYETITTNYSS